MTDLIFNIIAPAATGLVSYWGGWFFARKKYNSEVDNNNIKNMQESLEFYMKLSDDNSKRLEILLKQNEDLEKEVRLLRNKVFDLTTNMCLNLGCALRIRAKKDAQNNEIKE